MQDIVQVSVKDTGIGMTEKEIKKIFDEYYKADSSRHDFDSSGLGMPICKRIVEKHGGKIWAESDGKGKGSIFYFTLPATNKITNKQDIDVVNEYNLITEQIDNVVSK
jgi:signal transduction histidine kinase